MKVSSTRRDLGPHAASMTTPSSPIAINPRESLRLINPSWMRLTMNSVRNRHGYQMPLPWSFLMIESIIRLAVSFGSGCSGLVDLGLASASGLR